MLESLDISRTNIVNLPEEVYNITSLVELLADDIELNQLKPEIGQCIGMIFYEILQALYLYFSVNII